MVRVVSSNSPEEIARAQAKASFQSALGEFAAQIMRLSAGGGSGYDFDHRLASFIEALGEARNAGLRVSTFELQEMLDFTERDSGEPEMDRIARHSLRLAASRLQGIRVQATREQGCIGSAIRDREIALEARRRQWNRRPQLSDVGLVALCLSDAQRRAVRYFAVDRKSQREMRQPHPNTVRVMVRDGLLSDRRPPKLTDLGRKVLAHIEAKPEDGWSDFLEPEGRG